MGTRLVKGVNNLLADCVTFFVQSNQKIMDQEKSFVLHHVSLAENHNLERAGNLITQLHLEGGLPEDQTANDEMLKKLDLQHGDSTQQQEDATVQQFVFQGQCLILGDSGVGKTSLVKSLTGKPFDPREPKTQGIEQCLVDEKWKNVNTKDLIFGNLFWCYETISVLLTLYGTANPGNIILRDSVNWRNTFVGRNILLILLFCYFACLLFTVLHPSEESFIFSIFFLFVVFYIVLLYFFNYNYNFRLIVTTFFFTARRRGLLIGAFLAFIRVLIYYGKFSVNNDGRLQMTIIEVLVPGLLILYFRIKWHCPYQRQLKFKYHGSMKVVCFVPLLVSVLVGYISLLAVVSLLINYFKGLGKSIDELFKITVLTFVFWWTYELGKSAVKFTEWPTRGIFDNYSNMLASILFFGFCTRLHMYMYTYMSFDIIIICILVSDTLFREWQDIQKLGIEDNVSTAVVIEKQGLNKKKLKSALDKKFSSLKLRILDFAGDKEYYAYHHLFLRSDAIYIIVFNMAEFAKNDFGEIDAKCKGLQFWLNSVCSHVPPSTPIFLVGTHRGNIGENCMKIINRHLRRYLWDQYCDELVVNDGELDENLIFFPVENFDGQNDIGVQCLQKQIVSFAEQRTEQRKNTIPLSWIRIQDAVISLREKKVGKFCVTLNEFPMVFDTPDNFICTNWSEKTLKYFHKNGLVIYLDRKQETKMSNWVLLKPEILVDIITQLVTPSHENVQERGLRRSWKLLQKNGFVTKSLLRSIIAKQKENEEALTAFLEEYDLICPLENKKDETCNLPDEQPTHFVPSLLPMSAEGDTPLWHDGDTVKKCYVFFTRFLPEPLFHGLLSRAHKLSKLEFPNGETVIFRDAGNFWMSVWQPYRLKLLKKEKMIEVTFSCSNNRGLEPSAVLSLVFCMVDGICTRKFPFVEFHCGPACPSHECPGHQPNYPSYSGGEEQGPRRCHVYNVLPALQKDRFAFLYCKKHSFEEELREWVPNR